MRAAVSGRGASKMKLLAVTSDKRDPSVPNVPTLAEAGIPGLEVFSWQAIVAPKGLPKEVADKLIPAVIQAAKDAAVTKRLNDIGFEVVAGTPAEFRVFLDAELARWKQVIDTGGIKQSD